MATKKSTDDKFKVRVLSECALGQPNDVVLLDAETAAQYVGQVDPDKDAVAYAESLAG